MLLVVLGGVAVAALGVGGAIAFAGGGETSSAAEPPATTAPSTARRPSSTSSTTAAPTTTTLPPLAQPAPVALPAVPGGPLRQGHRSLQLYTYEERLAALHFDPGPVDGVFDERTRHAAEAFDKLMGWPRDGMIDQPFVDALATFRYPDPLVPQGEADRVEIDLDRQVLTVYKGWQVALISTTSTGNGKRFCGGADGCQYAVTPVGRYQFTWHVDGWRDGDLGRLYNPWYFNGGIAVHGYPSVPTKPASHGCARIPMATSEIFATLVYRGMAVYVVGTQAPEGGYPPDSVNGGAGSGGGSAPVRPPAPAPAPTPAPAPPPSVEPAPPPQQVETSTTTATTATTSTTTTPPPTTTAGP
ncbi:MAG: hypothetical protein KatS3mg009_3379 [Acidimicrobiia bacterium]|nr:MAG: hypothetical protein KatS3mg009_3379 [Acidimicrobiia bacterium]